MQFITSIFRASLCWWIFTINIVISYADENLGAQKLRDLNIAGSMSTDSVAGLKEQKVNLLLNSGLAIRDATLVDVRPDSSSLGIAFIKYKPERGSVRTVKAADVYQMWIGDKKIRFRYVSRFNLLVPVDENVADQIVTDRLASKGKKLLDPIEPDAFEQATVEHTKFLQEATEKLADLGSFRVDEYEAALIFTSLSPVVSRQLGNYIEQVNSQLNQMFGYPTGTSIWRGKPIIAAFAHTQQFVAFEDRVMEFHDHGGKPGVRQGDKRFLQTTIVEKMDAELAWQLVWGYTHGFVERAYSNATGYPWLNEGIADTVPYMVVPQARDIRRVRSSVLTQLQQTKSLLGVLDASKIDGPQRALCAELVRFLYQLDPQAFAQLFMDSKQGIEFEQAMKSNFGVDGAEFAAGFGRSVGIASVTP